MKTFLRENAPLIGVGVLGAVILLFVPLAPKKLWTVENIRKGPYRVKYETSEGRKDVRVTMEMDLETPAGFQFRASPLERLRGQSFEASWALHIEDIGSATLPCFESSDRACTFKIGASVKHLLVVPASGCAEAAGNALLCGGRVDMTPHLFYDIVLADSPVTLAE